MQIRCHNAQPFKVEPALVKVQRIPLSEQDRHEVRRHCSFDERQTVSIVTSLYSEDK